MSYELKLNTYSKWKFIQSALSLLPSHRIACLQAGGWLWARVMWKPVSMTAWLCPCSGCPCLGYPPAWLSWSSLILKDMLRSPVPQEAFLTVPSLPSVLRRRLHTHLPCSPVGWLFNWGQMAKPTCWTCQSIGFDPKTSGDSREELEDIVSDCHAPQLFVYYCLALSSIGSKIKGFWFLLLLLCCVIVFYCVALVWPATYFTGCVVLEFTEICLCLFSKGLN